MHQYYISSTKYSLQERQTKKHGKVYDVVFRIVTMDGEEKQKRLSGFTSKADAKAGYTEFITENCTLLKNNPLKKKTSETGSVQAPKVSELIPQYIISLQNQNKDSSIYDKQNIYELFVIPSLGNLTLSELTKERLYQWQDELWAMKNPRTNDFYSHAYLKKVRSHFSAFLAWCESRYGYANCFVSVKAPKRRASASKMQFWDRDEFDKFIAVVDNPMYHALFTMLFFTGRRKSEVFALTPDDVKEDSIVFSKTITRKTIDGSAYKITSTKNEKKDSTPISETLQKELANYEFQSPFLFGGESPLAENTVTRAFDRYIEKAGVKRIRMHDLRHSFVSMCIHLGANLMVVADLIGDTVEQVMKTYGHLYQEDKIAIIKKLK